MSTVTAIYEHGVFRPLEKVDLPEHSRVELSLSAPLPEPDPATLDAVYEVLSRRFRSGRHDTAERHNEHQP